MKMKGRKFWGMIITNVIFVTLFIICAIFAESALIVVGNTIVVMIGLFNSAWIGGIVFDTYVKSKHFIKELSHE